MIKSDMPSPLGHALAGIIAAWSADLVPGHRAWRTASASASFCDRAGGAVTLLCSGIAILPDLDLAFHAHRSVSHSLFAVALMTIISAAVTGWVTRRPVWRVAFMCGSAYGTHLLMDWLAVDTYLPYGLQVFWPFSHTWYISGMDLFAQTERRLLFSARSIRINLTAMGWETAILLPIVVLLWLVRVKALAGLAPKMSGGDHATQERTRAVLGVAETGVQHIENGKADV